MADATYAVRGTTRTQVYNSITKLVLNKNENGQYNHDGIKIFENGVKRILRSQFNTSDAGNGMIKLLDTNANPIRDRKSTNASTCESVLAQARAEARAASTANVPVAPTISTRPDAQEEADRENLLNQAIIGAKEGATEGITEMVGSEITDAVLRTIDGNDFKSVDEYHLHELIEAAFSGADRPATVDVLELACEIMGFHFNFQKKVHANVELLRAKAASLSAYGISFDESQIALIIIANIEMAAKGDYGREFRTVLQDTRRTYNYNHKHNAASVKAILKLLASADEVRTLKDAPAPNDLGGSTANSVAAESASYLEQLIHGPDTESEYESAYAATSDSDSSRETHDDRRRARKKAKEKKEKEKRRSRKSSNRGRSSSRGHGDEEVTCRHCKKYERRTPHPNTPEDKCFWNKKYKGFRYSNVCDELGIDFKPRSKFSYELGGYKKRIDSGSESN